MNFSQVVNSEKKDKKYKCVVPEAKLKGKKRPI